MGLDFPNPVGLAAGFDKDAADTDALATLGFGFLEVGAITPKPQLGNPSPRLFRLPQARALINRMGFNNCGAEAAAQHLSHRRNRCIIGINIGKKELMVSVNSVKTMAALGMSLAAPRNCNKNIGNR
jgi:dihydroorotate dehydrogenase